MMVGSCPGAWLLCGSWDCSGGWKDDDDGLRMYVSRYCSHGIQTYMDIQTILVQIPTNSLLSTLLCSALQNELRQSPPECNACLGFENASQTPDKTDNPQVRCQTCECKHLQTATARQLLFLSRLQFLV